MKANVISLQLSYRFLRSAACAVGVLASGVSLAASAPPQFTYQGRLMEVVNGVNTPVKSGTNDIFSVDMWVRLYDSIGADKVTGALYGRQVSVIVNKGAFSVDIGDEFGTPLSATYTNLLGLISACSGSTLLVGITPFADANNEIMPRQSLFSAPYALLANDVSQALGDFNATNGTSLFQALEVTGATLFKGVVTNLGTVSVSGNVTFTNGLSSSAALGAKQLSVGGGLTQSAGSATVGSTLEVGGNAAFQSGPVAVSGGTTLQGNVSASSLAVEGAMTAGALYAAATAGTITTPTLAYAANVALTVNGKAMFGSYFPASMWVDRSNAGTDSGSYVAPYDGLYLISAIIRRDNRGKGSLTFILPGSKTVKPEMLANTDQYGVNSVILTVLMKAGETVSWGSEVSENCTAVSQIEYRSFNKLMY